MQKITKKLFDIKSEVKKVHRNEDGYKFKYPTLTVIKDVIDPLLQKYKLLMLPEMTGLEDDRYTFKVHFYDIDSEESLTLTFVVKGDSQQNNGVQSSGATMSYMQRYIPKMVFDLDFVDDDPDHKKNSSPKKKAETPYNKLLKIVKDNNIKADDVKKAIKEVTGSVVEAKTLDDKQINNVINKLDVKQRVN